MGARADMSGKKKVLTEFFELDSTEADPHLLKQENRKKYEDGDEMFLSGMLAKAEELNGNGRRYPKNILKREIQNYKKLIRENRALGECDHPDSSTVHLDNASHMITRVWWDNGNEVHGNLKILDTDAGKNVKALIDGGVKLGISSRGLGSVREEQGDLVVEDDFQLIAFDLVSDPSTTGAFVMEEGNNKTLPDHMTKADRINRKLNDILMT